MPPDPIGRLADLLRRALAGEDVTAELRALTTEERAALLEMLRELRRGLE